MVDQLVDVLKIQLLCQSSKPESQRLDSSMTYNRPTRVHPAQLGYTYVMASFSLGVLVARDSFEKIFAEKSDIPLFIKMYLVSLKPVVVSTGEETPPPQKLI